MWALSESHILGDSLQIAENGIQIGIAWAAIWPIREAKVMMFTSTSRAYPIFLELESNF